MEEKQYIVWHSRYSVGNEMLDTQHREMLDTINTLYEHISAGARHINIIKTFKCLYQYANVHFREEEKAMQACDYPDLALHRAMHGIYIKRIDCFMEQFMYANIDIQYSVLPFLREWWKYHILRFDLKYMPYFKSARGEAYTRKQAAGQKNEQEKDDQNKRSRQQSSDAPRDKTVVKDEMYYAAILGLPQQINRDNLKMAYHQKVKEYHPDRVANLGIKIRMTATEEMEKINEAFDFFRKKYGLL